MMFDVLAEAGSAMDAEAVGRMLAVLLGGGAAGGGGYLLGRARRVTVSPQPLEVMKHPEYATKEELERVEQELREDIRDVQETARKTSDDVHQRLNGITVKLNNVDGKMDVVLSLLKNESRL